MPLISVNFQAITFFRDLRTLMRADFSLTLKSFEIMTGYFSFSPRNAYSRWGGNSLSSTYGGSSSEDWLFFGSTTLRSDLGGNVNVLGNVTIDIGSYGTPDQDVFSKSQCVRPPGFGTARAFERGHLTTTTTSVDNVGSLDTSSSAGHTSKDGVIDVGSNSVDEGSDTRSNTSTGEYSINILFCFSILNNVVCVHFAGYHQDNVVCVYVAGYHQFQLADSLQTDYGDE
uniref:Uncharacterized protein n=1 Tax=Tanacetum cinerariifolium TaxID=118510 RepID=A0A6L2JSS2_TANCI|nr:hypothetical protein [Tanacetum cinerariifolium]